MRLPRLPDGSGRWVLLGLILLPVAFVRIRSALMSDEQHIEARILDALEALEGRNPRKLRRVFARDYVDEGSGYNRNDIGRYANGLMAPGERYRGSLVEPDGLVFVDHSPEGVKPRTATVQVKCLIEHRFKTTEFAPWWDLEFTAEMIREDGNWRIHRTSDVNHDRRPR
ncbi:hypothetical protein Poly30_26680 [Planctomycetes bacterium Poly30]|uniref:Uncharacterized protein n=1 Tax=Saltatorellus ferox TaxID=2528018 RepID=A0A518ESS9_9BACT|nr:hypothetical protein Poly30_26680 [Planctomycetes bacterium Poly30]